MEIVATQRLLRRAVRALLDSSPSHDTANPRPCGSRSRTADRTCDKPPSEPHADSPSHSRLANRRPTLHPIASPCRGARSLPNPGVKSRETVRARRPSLVGWPAQRAARSPSLAVGGGLEPPTFRLTAGRCTSSTTPQRRNHHTGGEKRSPGSQRFRDPAQGLADLLGPLALREVREHERLVLETVGAVEDVVEVDVRVLRARETSSGRTKEHSRSSTFARRICGAASKMSCPQSPGYARAESPRAASRWLPGGEGPRSPRPNGPRARRGACASLRREIADRRNTVAAREDAQLEIVPKREAIAGLRRDDLRLVANVLETLARGDPGRHVLHGRRRDEDARRGSRRASGARRDAPCRPCDRDARARRRRWRSRPCLRARGRTRAACGRSAACRKIRGRRSRRPRSGSPPPRSRRGRGRAGSRNGQPPRGQAISARGRALGRERQVARGNASVKSSVKTRA